MGFSLVWRRAINVPLELLQEIIVRQVLLLLLFLLFTLLGRLNLNLVDNIERAAIVPLQVRPS